MGRGGMKRAPVEGRRGTKGGCFTLMATRPGIREWGLEPGQGEVTDHQAEAGIEGLDMRCLDIAQPTQEGPQGTEDGLGMLALRPEFLQRVLGQEHTGQIGLGVEVQK